jgi:hypothetical protein
MFTKKNVITARFINDSHTTVEVVHTIKGDDKAHAYFFEYDKDCDEMKQLDKAGWNLEILTDETIAYKREASRVHDESLHNAAMKFLHENPPEEVVIERIENIKVDDIIGSIISKNEDEDMLFRAKLAVMELPAAKASKKTKVKQDIRKAKSLIELISNISKL